MDWKNDEKLARLGYHECGYGWSSLACCKRYVEDLLVASRMWCFDCLTEMVPHVYTVQCDVEPQATVLTWLDMRNCAGVR